MVLTSLTRQGEVNAVPVTLSAQETEYLTLLKRLGATEREQVMNGMKKIATSHDASPSSTEDNFVKELTGYTYSDEEKIKLEMESLFQYFQKRKQLLAGSLTAPQVAELLGTSRQTPHDRLKKRSLLAVLDNGALRFPLWQFDPEGPDGAIAGLPEVLKTLEASDFAKLNWLVRPNPLLDGLTPVQALKQGDRERVIQEAASVGASTW
jgi:hypothetical protein